MAQNDRLNLALSFQAMIGNFGASAVLGVFMYYLLSTLQLTPEQSGVNYSLIGIGGLLGSLIAIPLEKVAAQHTNSFTPICWSNWLNFRALEYILVRSRIAFGVAMTCNIAWNTIVATVRRNSPIKYARKSFRVFTCTYTISYATRGIIRGIISAYNPVYVFALAAFTKLLEVLLYYVVRYESYDRRKDNYV